MSAPLVTLAAIERPPSQSQLAYEQLRTALRNAQFGGGSLLTESDLARQLGVSTTPVHDAMVRLASEGFVELLPRRGARVVRLTIRDVEEIFEVREALEAEVTRLAQARMTPEDFAHLEDHLQQGKRGIDRNDYPTFNAADVALHDCVAQAANNQRLLRLLGEIRIWVQRVRFATVEHQFNLPGRPEKAQDEHAELVEALRQRDGRAEEIVRRHVSSLKADIVAHMESQGLDSI
ncbi:MAG TPA: GntR family transcriptional regulator [Dehalococcoidia bacterium]|nr:GntR family transcriptional regulator [Dehalococcoidia bacterium]